MLRRVLIEQCSDLLLSPKPRVVGCQITKLRSDLGDKLGRLAKFRQTHDAVDESLWGRLATALQNMNEIRNKK